jgi:hypothetical protein
MKKTVWFGMGLCSMLAALALAGCAKPEQAQAGGAAAAGQTQAAPAAAAKQEKPETPVSDGIAAIQTAYSLARYGYSNYSASALIGAAEIISQTQTQPLGVEGKAKGEAGGAPETAHPEFTPANLLADAKNFASGDATMLAWADKVASASSGQTRGAVGGPREGIEVVNGRGTVTFKLPFQAGRTATVFVSGDGSSDLDLYVYDENGNLISCDEDYSDDCLVRWTPRWTGSFIIEVVNQGRNWNRFTLATD